MKKKAMSAVIATVLIILIVVVGVGIVWKVVLPLFAELKYFSYSDVSLNIVFDGYTVYDTENHFAFVQVARGQDKVNLTGIEIGFNFEGNTVTYQTSSIPQPGGRYTYKFNFTADEVDGVPDKVTVAPVFTINNRLELGRILDDKPLPSMRVSLSEDGWARAQNDSALTILRITNPDGTWNWDTGGGDGDDSDPGCIPVDEICDNGVDEDCDTDIDCQDSDCDAQQGNGGMCEYSKELSCEDGFNNDGDTYADCIDSDCFATCGQVDNEFKCEAGGGTWLCSRGGGCSCDCISRASSGACTFCNEDPDCGEESCEMDWSRPVGGKCIETIPSCNENFRCLEQVNEYPPIKMSNDPLPGPTMPTHECSAGRCVEKTCTNAIDCALPVCQMSGVGGVGDCTEWIPYCDGDSTCSMTENVYPETKLGESTHSCVEGSCIPI